MSRKGLTGRAAWAQLVEGTGRAAPPPAGRVSAPISKGRGGGKPRVARKRLSDLLGDIHQALQEDKGVPMRQEVSVTPVPKPRMTSADRWKKRDCVLRYRAACDELRLRGAKLPHQFHVIFVLPMPASWPEWQKKEVCGRQHLRRPDTSNLVKWIEDALVPKDETLWRGDGIKVWGREGRLIILRGDQDPMQDAALAGLVKTGRQDNDKQTDSQAG